MTHSQELETWAVGLTKKRFPEVLEILVVLCREGLKTNRITAEAAHRVPVTSAKTRGVVGKYMSRLGFVCVGFEKAKSKASKGHLLRVWELQKPHKAREVLGHLEKAMLGLKPIKPVQATMDGIA